VSGDFYWSAFSHEHLMYLAVCDSTGHGVPGAFMSLLNISFLNEAIKEQHIAKPNDIFDHVRSRLIESLSQEGGKDGMDAILICYDKQNKQLTYAAANNAPLLIKQDGTIVHLPCDKMPVGKGERQESFSNYAIDYSPGDSLYLYTDGYADQFGGPKGKKFKYKQLEELLQKLSVQPSAEQAAVLDQTFTDWKGDLEQVDDICIIGIKL
jgi:serine phosphatase RsbU (regulator of sigma subunit)